MHARNLNDSIHHFQRDGVLALLCPITNQRKGYPFEVRIPSRLRVTGVVLADQIKSLDWRVRQAEFICALPAETVAEVLAKLATLLSGPV